MEYMWYERIKILVDNCGANDRAAKANSQTWKIETVDLPEAVRDSLFKSRDDVAVQFL